MSTTETSNPPVGPEELSAVELLQAMRDLESGPSLATKAALTAAGTLAVMTGVAGDALTAQPADAAVAPAPDSVATAETANQRLAQAARPVHEVAPAESHTVQPGETLSGIITDHGWQGSPNQIASHFGLDPDVIYPGQVFHDVTAGPSGTVTETVDRGENRTVIAAHYGVPVDAVRIEGDPADTRIPEGATAIIEISASAPAPASAPEAAPAPAPEAAPASSSDPNLGQLLDTIAEGESRGNYNAYFGNVGNNSVDFTSMTISEVMDWQQNNLNGESTAIGRYQFINGTLNGIVTELNIDPQELFDEDMQDRLATGLMERRGLSDYLNGNISREEFAHKLSQEWASLPTVTGSNPNASYYAGVGSNRALISPDQVLGSIDTIDDPEPQRPPTQEEIDAWNAAVAANEQAAAEAEAAAAAAAEAEARGPVTPDAIENQAEAAAEAAERQTSAIERQELNDHRQANSSAGEQPAGEAAEPNAGEEQGNGQGRGNGNTEAQPDQTTTTEGQADGNTEVAAEEDRAFLDDVLGRVATNAAGEDEVVEQPAPTTTTTAAPTTTTTVPPTTTTVQQFTPEQEAFLEAVAANEAYEAQFHERVSNFRDVQLATGETIKIADVAGADGVPVAVNVEIANMVASVMQTAEDNGVPLGGWGYRSADRQIELRAEHCDVDGDGASNYDIYERPSSQCSPPTATPGNSMHEKGLAVDFHNNGDGISDRNSEIFLFLNHAAQSAGLINLPSEAWHWSINGH